MPGSSGAIVPYGCQIVSRLVDAGLEVVSTDLIQRDYGLGGVDFLGERQCRAKHIVTNPPYGGGLGDAFIRHALALTRETGGTVAMLLNLASLCHPKRHPLWINTKPAVIYALDQLVCWPEGHPELAPRRGPDHRYCWVIWKPGHDGPTQLSWLSTAAFSTPGG